MPFWLQTDDMYNTPPALHVCLKWPLTLYISTCERYKDVHYVLKQMSQCPFASKQTMCTICVFTLKTTVI